MNKNSRILKGFLTLMMVSIPLFAGGVKLQYNLKPGQEWETTLSSQSESDFMGQKSIQRNKKTFLYEVSKGSKKGWISITAHIKKSAKDAESGLDMSRMSFKADMHNSGEFRHISYSGNPMTQPQSQDMPPQMQAMMEKQGEMMGEAHKHAIFWFPELPEDSLQVGDEFDVQREIGMGSGAMQAKSVIKQVFTLEEVSKGLAYFSVRQRSITKTKSDMGGKSETKISGKGEAIFDLKIGMWLELTEKSKAKVEIGGIPGMGDLSSNMKLVHKYEMELR